MAVEPGDLYDSDILAFERVQRELDAFQGEQHDMEGFRQRAIDAYARVGWKVDVLTYATDQPGVYAFDVVLEERTEKHEFDHERLAHEVQRDILEISQPGTITADGKLIDPSSSF